MFERKGIPKDEAGPDGRARIFFPRPRESDHNESADNEDYHQMKGDSKDFLSLHPRRGGRLPRRQAASRRASMTTMGVGGGGGGGGRTAAGSAAARTSSPAAAARAPRKAPVLEALKWLARHQSPDGSWKAEAFHAQCAGGGKCSGTGMSDYDTGVTGLSLLAFLGAGYSHLSRDEFPDPVTPGRMLKFGQVVRDARCSCRNHQTRQGCIGERGPKYMYNTASPPWPSPRPTA